MFRLKPNVWQVLEPISYYLMTIWPLAAAANVSRPLVLPGNIWIMDIQAKTSSSVCIILANLCKHISANEYR